MLDMVVVGQSYHLKDEFFDLVDDDKLMSNKEDGGYRPHFCAIQDRLNRELFWMIPISSKYEKYQNIHDKMVANRGRCDKIVLGRFAGNNCAFLVQNAFCVRQEFIDHVHTVNGVPVTIHSQTVREIRTKLRTCLALKKQGRNLFFTDIDKIIGKLN